MAGIAIREIFAPFTGHPSDFELWVRLGYYVSQGRDPYLQYPPVAGLSFPSDSFNPTWPGYPPLWPLLLSLIYKLYATIGIQSRFFYYFLIKQPMIAADVIDSLLIYKLIKSRTGYDNGIKALAFWMLCPYTILISSIWGMFDQITLLFVLLALYFILTPWKSAFLEAVAITLKLIPSIYLPLFAGVQKSAKRMLGYVLLSISSFAALALFPYVIFRNWNLSLLFGVGFDATNRFGQTLNYWEPLNNYWVYVNYAIPPSTEIVLRFIGLIWIPAVLLATYFCVKSIRKRGQFFETDLVLSLLFITVVFFLSKSVINEQYVTYFVGFGLFDYFVFSNKLRKKLFHAMWISALVELSVNNAFLLAFFEPISPYYTAASNYFFFGGFNPIRLALMAALGVLFSIFTFLYLISLYRELKQPQKQPVNLENTPIIH